MSKRLAAGVLVVAVTLFLLYQLGSWWSRSSPDVYLRTDLIDVRKPDALLTGFATLALVQFRNGGALEPFHRIHDMADSVYGRELSLDVSPVSVAFSAGSESS